MPDAPAQPDLSMEEILAVIRRNIAEDARPPGLRPPAPEAVEVLELTDVIEADGTVRRIPRSPGPAPGGMPDTPVPPDNPQPPQPPRQRLERELTIAAGSRSLEDLVAELLRPLLREWLDAHLPAVIERLAREEMPARAMKAD